MENVNQNSMINKQELRIGNYIRDKESGRIGYVISIGEKKCTVKMPFSKLSQSYDDFEGIDLNEDWLLKLGFERNRNEYFISSFDRFNVFITAKNLYIFCDDEKIIRHINNIHELQNIYLSTTVQHLTIKEDK